MINKMNHKFVLPDKFNENLNLLKRHLTFQESDHILNILYNAIWGGICLEKIELNCGEKMNLSSMHQEA